MEPQPLYLVHIHTKNMDHYALRNSLENAQEEIFQYAQSNWSVQFPGIDRPSSKLEVIEQYYRAVQNEVYAHLVDISPEGNWVMEEVSSKLSKKTEN